MSTDKVSIIVPVYNEAGNIAPLVAEIDALKTALPLGEIIYVDDASSDTTHAELQALKAQYPLLRVLRHSVRSGQSAGLCSGIRAARFPLVATLDGDGQNNPADIIALHDCYVRGASPATMVMGERAVRRDNALRRFSSRVANGVRGALLNDGVRDTGCALKLFRRQDFLLLPAFNHMHRFLPALMRRQGVGVALMPVGHRARLHGVSKYGVLNRLAVGIADIGGVMWLKARSFPQHLHADEE